MNRTAPLLAALAAAALALPAADSQARPRGGGFVVAATPAFHGRLGVGGGHGHWRGGRWWGGVSIGIGLPLLYEPYAYGYPYYAAPYYPGTVLVAPPGGYAEPLVQAPAAPAPPEPVIYPNHGQSAARTEADRQACNRWATTQPSAMADASVFHRATQACMEGRGYTVR